MTRRWRVVRPLAALGLAAALTTALAQSTTSAAFTATTGDPGNQVNSAATFCASPGTTILSPTADAAVYEVNANTKYGTTTGMGVGAGTATGMRAFTFIAFALASQQPMPARCQVTSAKLNLFASTPTTGATLEAYRATAAWDQTTITWNTGRPGLTGTPTTTTSLATSTTGWQQWDVTLLTRELYAGPDYGFALRDSQDVAGSARYQTWDSMESGNASHRPTLELTWG